MEAQPTSQPPAGPKPWKSMWQLPALAAAALLLGLGVTTVILSAPKTDPVAMLAAAEKLIESNQAARAIEELDSRVARHLDAMGATDRARFELARARALSKVITSHPGPSQADHRLIIESYKTAESAGSELAHADLVTVAESLLATSQTEAAQKIADAIGKQDAELRSKLYRTMVEELLDRRPVKADAARRLLDAFLDDPELSVDDQGWAVARQTELLLAEDEFSQAIDQSIKALIWLEDASGEVRGDLHLLLARGLVATGQDQASREHLQKAIDMAAGPTGQDAGVRGRAIVLLGGVEVRAGNIEHGRELLRRAMIEAPGTASEAEAMLGLAEAEAMLGNDTAALDRYDEITTLIEEGRPAGRVTPDRVRESALAWYQRRLQEGEGKAAYEYALRAENLYAQGKIPDDVLLAMADANRLIAETMLAEATQGEGHAALSTVPEGVREMIQRRFRAAGAYYRAHADRVILTDNDLYSSSLWNCADALDRAGDLADALGVFEDYASAFVNTPGQAEARFRAARLLQAMGEYALAAHRYQGIIDDSLDVDRKHVGYYAEYSYVPLAQCMLLDTDPANDAKAESVLTRAMAGELGDPRSQLYHDALLELGKMYYDQGRHAQAIDRLEEACERYPDDPEKPLILFRLADAHRQSALAGHKQLDNDVMPHDERLALEADVRRSFREAMGLFTDVIAALGSQDQARLSPVEKVYLRNSSFYRADCAYQLGDYETAIHYNVEARDRYSTDPASLVAMIQIVHAHMRLGEMAEARTANDRAKRFYRSLPPEVWDDPTLPLRASDWERWLDSMEKLTELAEAG